MTESKLLIDEHLSGDVAVLTLAGQMLLDDGDLAFRRQIHDVIDRGVTKIVVDLAGVELELVERECDLVRVQRPAGAPVLEQRLGFVGLEDIREASACRPFAGYRRFSPGPH